MGDNRPCIQQVGDVELWWVGRPAGPRTSLTSALRAVILVGGLLGGALVWTWHRHELLWPWQTITPVVPSASQLAIRYLSIAWVGLAYIVIRSIPGWVRLGRQSRDDAEQARALAEQGAWASAALRLHRGMQLARELWGGRRPPAWAVALDGRIREHLSVSRRLYAYYTGDRPTCPDSPESGFAPRIVPVSRAGGWWVVPVVLVLAAGVAVDIGEAMRNRQYAPLLSFNFVLTATIVLVWGGMQVMTLLGWRSYFRFAPGVAELLTYRIWRSRAHVETIALREHDVMLDLMAWHIVLTLLDRRRNRYGRSYYIRRTADNYEACLRAVLSSAAIQSLSSEDLAQ